MASGQPAARREQQWKVHRAHRQAVHRPGHRQGDRQRGLSLVELAVAVVVLGVVVLVAWRHGENAARQPSDARSRALLERADEAVRAHAFVNARLPCPATDAQGREACDGRIEGFLPYRTLGLPDTSAGTIRYRLDAVGLGSAEAGRYRVPVPVARDGGNGGDGGDDQDRLTVERVPLRDIAAPGADRTIDFCAALGTPGAPDAHGTGGDVAFTLAWSLSPLAGPASAMPLNGGAASPTRVVRRSRLWSDLSCAALLSTAGRAHFNARLAAAVMRQAIGDYRRQSDVARGLSEWDFSQSHWFLANSAYGALKTGIKLDIASAAWLASLRTDPAPATAMALATAALATSVLHMSVYASTVARGAFNLANARANRDVLDRLAGRAEMLEREIARRASVGGSNFVFLARRQAEPWPARQAASDATSAALPVDARATGGTAPVADAANDVYAEVPVRVPAGEILAREALRYRDAIGRL
jgi:prepilin-type N-terminal cleavage/methylation domain-containing protein